jgi:hypothetical protein
VLELAGHQGEVRLAKKRISSVDLSWLILEEMGTPTSRAARAALAVVPDAKLGWRAVVAASSRRSMTADIERRLADVQQRLRAKYDLGD